MTSTSVFQGNFGGKPSSRVMRPPGGGSSNIFGAPEEVKKPAPAPPAPSSEAQAPAAEPMASEPLAAQPPAVEASAADEPSVGEPATTVVPEPSGDEKPSTVSPGEDGSGEPALVVTPPAAVTTTSAEKSCAGNQSNAGDTRKKRIGYNPITGEAYEQAENSAKTSISVRQPPGGASSGLW